MSHTPSPLAPAVFPALPAIPGIALATCHTGMRYKNRDDLLWMSFAEGTTVAGVFTRNTMTGAPVDWCKRILPQGKARALVVNAGKANVFIGAEGERIVQDTAAAAAQLLGCSNDEIYLSSTGIIGQGFDVHYLTDNLRKLHENQAADGWEAAAKAIVTTDTFPKGVTRQATIGGVPVTINGFAKGSGMIAPNMATMLAYFFTDAAIPAPLLQELTAELVDRSFNCITVDSDTSTSDTLLVFATGQARHPTADLSDFKAKLLEAMIELAQLVVKDGEGAKKFITVTVSGAKDDVSARRMGLAIANSPLVKTAIAGEDPNWGRIVMAIGKTGEPLAREKIMIRIGDAVIAKNGALNPDYTEAPTAEYMKGQDISIAVDAGIGQGRATVWTCDLTHEYISINADYRS